MTDTEAWQHGPNAEQVAHWNRDESAHWVVAADRYDGQLRPLGEAAMERAAFRPGERVLDIGCGCGHTTLDIAARVAPSGTVTGVDVSAPMLALAEAAARDAGVSNVRFVHGDAQVHPFPEGAFDAAFSRFGVMFFADPSAAFTNVRRSLRPGGRLVFVCWRELAEQQWLMVPAAAALAHVPMPDLGAPGQPGMFALADADQVRAILDAAGFVEVGVEAVNRPITYAGGGGVDEVVAFLSEGSLGRTLLADAPPETVRVALTTVRGALVPYETADGVVADAAVWVVTATAP